MRKVYMIDLGLLIAAGTIAIVLTAKPVSSQVQDAGPDRAPASLAGHGVVVQEFSKAAVQEAHGEKVSEPDR